MRVVLYELDDRAAVCLTLKKQGNRFTAACSTVIDRVRKTPHTSHLHLTAIVHKDFLQGTNPDDLVRTLRLFGTAPGLGNAFTRPRQRIIRSAESYALQRTSICSLGGFMKPQNHSLAAGNLRLYFRTDPCSVARPSLRQLILPRVCR